MWLQIPPRVLIFLPSIKAVRLPVKQRGRGAIPRVGAYTLPWGKRKPAPFRPESYDGATPFGSTRSLLLVARMGQSQCLDASPSLAGFTEWSLGGIGRHAVLRGQC